MSAQSNYRKAFLVVRALLQKRDPHGLMAKYSGDRFDDEIYGYEATTIIESLKSDRSSARVEELLESLAVKNRREVNAEASGTVSAEIAEVLGAL